MWRGATVARTSRSFGILRNPAYPDCMPAQLSDRLAKAALNDRERRVIARILSALRAELGDDLLALWLYGSRARGEADPDETHHDRRSDVDMIAILDPARNVNAFDWDFTPKLIAAVEAGGDSPSYYSLHIYSADRLRNRRQIRSFFFQEVDRDKLVLAGSALEGPAFQ
jgi:predicted nucleotidyltransferase